MHVRQGDACGDGYRTGRTCSPLSDYMVYAEEVRAATGANTIYLATDAADVLNQTANFPTWNFVHMREALEWQAQLKQLSAGATRFGSMDGTKSQTWDDVMRYDYSMGNVDFNRKTVWETNIDIHLFSLTDIFIGKHTSNFFRSAYELHAGRCKCAAPMYSLDAPWCFDWGVDAGVSSDGQGKFMC